MGSEPESWAASSFTPQALPRAKTTAISCSEEIALTVREEPVAERTSSAPVRSCQNGRLIVFPPSDTKASSSETGAMIPLEKSSESSAVFSITYGFQTAGTITSESRVAAMVR